MLKINLAAHDIGLWWCLMKCSRVSQCQESMSSSKTRPLTLILVLPKKEEKHERNSLSRGWSEGQEWMSRVNMKSEYEE